MNKTIPETNDFLAGFVPAIRDVENRDVAIAPPFTSLFAAVSAIGETNILLAAQDVFWEEKGAYTGEVSPQMLVDAGCAYVIVGHSERRQYFGEDDSVVNKKIKAAQGAGLGVIFCVGELLEEREAGNTFDVVKRQIEAGLDDITPDNLVVAYEPVWAIGTGRTATVEQAQEVHAFMRKLLADLYGNKAEEMRIIYGGSVTPDNIDSLMASKDINGALVGGASLKPESFSRIVNFRKVNDT
jgi:triosephosphate isomerase